MRGYEVRGCEVRGCEGARVRGCSCRRAHRRRDVERMRDGQPQRRRPVWLVVLCCCAAVAGAAGAWRRRGGWRAIMPGRARPAGRIAGQSSMPHTSDPAPHLLPLHSLLPHSHPLHHCTTAPLHRCTTAPTAPSARHGPLRHCPRATACARLALLRMLRPRMRHGTQQQCR